MENYRSNCDGFRSCPLWCSSISYKIRTGSDTAEITEAIVFRAEISLNKKYDVEIKVTAPSDYLAVYLNPLVSLPCSDCPFHRRVMSFTVVVFISSAE